MNVFADEWRDCLREQYLYVVRENDHKTLVSLTQVLLDVGFTEAELREFQVIATMHVDDVPADFVPDIDILEPRIHAGVEVSAEASTEETAPEPEDDMPPTYEEILEEAEATVAAEEPEPEDDEPDDPDSPAQLSLF